MLMALSTATMRSVAILAFGTGSRGMYFSFAITTCEHQNLMKSSRCAVRRHDSSLSCVASARETTVFGSCAQAGAAGKHPYPPIRIIGSAFQRGLRFELITKTTRIGFVDAELDFAGGSDRSRDGCRSWTATSKARTPPLKNVPTTTSSR